MKRVILAVLLLSCIQASCGEKKGKPFDAAAQAATDDAGIQAYIKANHLHAVKDSSGLYYEILRQGSGPKATASSTVQVKYIGKLIDGSIFDQTDNDPRSFPLNAVIPGWTIGIPLVKTGGKIMLPLPSALGYGNNSPGAGIPENSILIFTIDILSVK